MPYQNLNYLNTEKKRPEIVASIMKESEADLILEKGMLVNVYTAEIYNADVAIYGDRIGYIGDCSILKAKKRVNCSGKYLTPGLMDGHLHIDSCMVNVTNYAKGVLPLGITSVFIDSHEIGNALGMEGVHMMVEEGKTTPLRVFQYVPAQVPCGDEKNQTPNFYIGLDETQKLYQEENVFGLGEVSKYKVVNNDPYFMEKIEWVLEQGGVVDGSAHDFTDKNLQAYVASGIFADHESVNGDIAWERARNGLTVMMRNGTTQKDVDKCVMGIIEGGLDTSKFCFCSDDRHPVDIVKTGSINSCIDIVIEKGIRPINAVQMATLNCAKNFRVDGELGGIAPGKIADILVVDNLEKFLPEQVYIGGKLVAEKGKMVVDFQSPQYAESILHSFHVSRTFSKEDMVITIPGVKDGEHLFNIIHAMPGNIWSGWDKDSLTVEDSQVNIDLDKDIIKVIVVERYGRTKDPNIGRALIRGFGLKKGAIAQSLAQDIHDVVAIGVDDSDLTIAINRVCEMNGGLCVVCDGEIQAELQLPIGGIMCDKSVQEIAQIVGDMSDLITKKMGGIMPDPMACLQFQTHPMIPYLKISDIGLIDINNQKIIDLIIE